MKTSQLAVAIFVLCCCCSTALFAEDEKDTRNPVDKYHGDAFFYSLTCKLSFQIAMSKRQLSQPSDEKDDYRACITKGKTASKQNLDAALKTVKKPNAKEALKTYHVALVSALEGINPGSDERKINYEQRQQNLEGKMTEAWARFEIEQ